MKRNMYKQAFAIALCALTLVSIVNFVSIAFDIRIMTSTPQIEKAEKYFPIESFVMVTQDLLTFQQICNEDNEECLPLPDLSNKISGTGSGVIVGQRDGKSLVVTAGHVCAGGSDLIPMVENLNVQYRIDLETGYGKTGVGTILSIDMINDLCLMISDTYPRTSSTRL